MLNTASPKTTWLTLLRSMEALTGGDRGAALVRLAELAAEVHRELEAEELTGGWVARMLDDEEDRAHGRARGCVVAALDGGSEGTEANR